jgi:integrase
VATLYKRGPAYYLNWREGGVQYRRSLGAVDRETAQALRAEKEAELHGLLTPTRGVSVEAVIADYLAWYEKNRPTTYRRAKSALKGFREDLGAYAAESLPAKAIEAWAARHPAPGTAEKALKLARAAFRKKVAQRTLAHSPMDGVTITKAPISRAPDYYRPAQLKALYATPRGALWEFMAMTGIRRGEMAKARRKDVENGLLLVESTAEGRTKSGRWRAIPLNPEAKAALKGLGKDRLADVHPDTLGDWFKADATAAGLPGSLHWLRHTFCTILVQSGVTLHEVKRLAGHSSIAVTEKYAHHAPGFGRSAVATMGAWMQGGAGEKHTRKHSSAPKPRRPRSSAG